MTLVVRSNVLFQPQGEAVALVPRRRRLSTIMRRQSADRRAIPLVFRNGQDWRRASRGEIDKAVRLRSQYATTLVGPHDTVVLYQPPRGKNGASIGLALAAIALTAIAGPVGAAIGGALGFAAQAGLRIASNALSLQTGKSR